MIRVLALGQCAIELDGTRVSAESEMVFGLLLYLAARAGTAVSRDTAQELLWPDLTHTRGRHCLRQAAYRLRQLGVPLCSDNLTLSVPLGVVTSDYAALIANDAPAAAFSGLPISEILPGYLPTFSTPFAAWVEEYRARLTQRIRHGLVRAIVDLRSKGRYREAEPLARVCLTCDPFNEIATLTLAEATAVLGGNRAEALAILDRYVDEIGSSPDRRLALSASVLRRRISERFVEQRYAAPPDPPFVGREDVLELLVEKMQESVAGRSKIVYLWGEPGIGKTRLLEELSKVAHVQGVRVERYAVSPNDPERPLALFSSILPRMMRMTGAVGISPEAYEAIQRFVDPSAWERVDPPRTAAEAAVVFGRLKAGISELFEALSDERALALLVDDMHWCDQRSLEVLSEVVEHVRERRVAFVLTSREGCTGHESRRLEALCARAAVRRLDGLDARQVESLLAQIAEQRNFRLTSEFVRRTVDTSAGNPLFVSELATHYGWNGVRDDLPHNMQTLLQKRLDALSADAQLLFQVCAVLGDYANVDRIGKVLQATTHSLLRALHEVESACLLAAVGDRAMCRHELLRREALARLTPIARKMLHHKAALVLEHAALGEVSLALCWEAMQTWLVADQPDRALKLLQTMAGRLLGSGLGRDADNLLTNARTLLTTTEQAAAILPLQWLAARAHGDVERSLNLALECQRFSGRAGFGPTESLLAELAAFDASRVMETSTKMQLDFDRLERATESPDVLTELALRIVIHAEDLLEPAIAHKCFTCLTAGATLARAGRGRRMLFELVYHSGFGDMETAVARARQIVVLAETPGMRQLLFEPQRLRWAYRPLMLAGQMGEALAVLERSKSVARRNGSLVDESVAELYRVETLILMDCLHEGEELLSNLESQTSPNTPLFIGTGASAVRAHLAFALGRFEECSAALDRVEVAADPQQVRRNVMLVDSLKVLLALNAGHEPDAARVDRLNKSWSALASLGSGDLPFLAITAVLVTHRMNLAAAEMSEHYRSTRRERFALPRSVVAQYEAILARNGAVTPDGFRFFTESKATSGIRLEPPAAAR